MKVACVLGDLTIECEYAPKISIPVLMSGDTYLDPDHPTHSDGMPDWILDIAYDEWVYDHREGDVRHFRYVGRESKVPANAVKLKWV